MYNDLINGFCEKYSLERRLWSTNAAAGDDCVIQLWQYTA